MLVKIHNKIDNTVTSRDCIDFAEVMAFFAEQIGCEAEIIDNPTLGRFSRFNIGSYNKEKPSFVLTMKGDKPYLPVVYNYSDVSFNLCQGCIAFYFDKVELIEFYIIQRLSECYSFAIPLCEKVENYRDVEKKGGRRSDD